MLPRHLSAADGLAAGLAFFWHTRVFDRNTKEDMKGRARGAGSTQGRMRETQAMFQPSSSSTQQARERGFTPPHNSL